MSDNEINDSRFYMWRTLFAVVHADNIVTDEEIGFMAHVLDDVNFSDDQTAILKDDISNAKNAENMFDGVTSHKDRTEFFELARDLVWIDGDFGSEEQSVMIKLHQAHIKRTDVDEMAGYVSLQLEEEQQPSSETPSKPQEQSAWAKLASILKRR